MIITVCCEECGESSIDLNSVSVNVTLTKYIRCEKCHRSHDEKKNYFFCSTDCLNKFITDKQTQGKSPFK